ncbi:PAS domain-containing sensor histidine kinase [uncultured Kiloniella sp.]|uniref:PAS domain-containing sensor histidine kinase n=1 Tax=uncultured Kiloniella sp. TaxID=1133091 RepID=UPI00262724F0|nr:PAS domain-containing sensor histidine kinase [uncultured Kiloniella sp.]
MPTPESLFTDFKLDSAELLEAIFSASGTYFVITDPQTGLIHAISDAWLKTLKYKREEVVGRTSQELNIWLGPEKRAEMIRRIKTDKAVSRFHACLRGKDGSLHDFSVSIQSVVLKNKNYLLFCGYDITEEIKVKNSAVSSRKMLVDALEAMSEGFVLYDPNGLLVICNSKFKEFYGYSDDEAKQGVVGYELGKLDIERGTVIVIEGSEDDYMNRRADLAKGPPKATVVKLKDDRYLLLSDRVTEDGYIVSIQKDITDIKEAEFALMRARDEAHIANNTKSEFLAHMSHELRTPLNSILGFTQVMRDELLGDLGHPRYREYINDVHHSGEHLLNLINDVLDISKVESGKFELNEDVLDLKDTISACMQIIRGRTDAAALNIEVTAPKEKVYFRGDERIMRQILLNLLTNAVKFTPNDGKVLLDLKKNSDHSIKLIISDTGCGIEENDIPVVLAPFGQARINARTAHEGTGLGLSLSKMLTELHDGTLGLTSKVGKGTQITLDFPVERYVDPASI